MAAMKLSTAIELFVTLSIVGYFAAGAVAMIS